MGREINKFIISAVVSGGIHLAIFFLLIYTTPALLRVQELPGSIEVSLGTGAHQEAPEGRTSAKTIKSWPLQQEIETATGESSPTTDALARVPGIEEGTPGRGNADRRGDSALAIPQYGGNPKPPYPEVARRRGYEGTVRLKVEVLASGKVGEIRIKESSGYEVLDHSALKAVKEWSFIPARFAGIPVKTTVIVPVTFCLRDQLAAGIR